MKTPLTDLMAQAQRLSHLAHPVTNALLTVLAGLEQSEAEEYVANGNINIKTINNIANRLRLAPEIIATTFDRQIAKDLLDYEPLYSDQLRAYHQSGIGDDRIACFLKDHTDGDVFVFILHEWFQLWSPQAGVLDDWFIDDPEDAENRFSDIVKGYLISLGRACPTTLRLLEESYVRQWPNWEELWRWF